MQRLEEERLSLTQRRDSFKQLLDEMNQKYEALKSKLQENETHAQVRVFTLHLEEQRHKEAEHMTKQHRHGYDSQKQ